ncbi:Nitrate/nitrite response regulator protein NarL, partial [Haemophilus influenzae]
GET